MKEHIFKDFDLLRMFKGVVCTRKIPIWLHLEVVYSKVFNEHFELF